MDALNTDHGSWTFTVYYNCRSIKLVRPKQTRVPNEFLAINFHTTGRGQEHFRDVFAWAIQLGSDGETPALRLVKTALHAGQNRQKPMQHAYFRRALLMKRRSYEIKATIAFPFRSSLRTLVPACDNGKEICQKVLCTLKGTSTSTKR